MIEINGSLDRRRLSEEFARTGRLQIKDALTSQSAERLQALLREQTPWGLAWQARDDGPHSIRAERVPATTAAEAAQMRTKIGEALRGRDYAFLYSHYPLVTAYLERWHPGSAHERLLESLNGPDFLDLLRQVTSRPDVVKVDGQATLYGPGNFLSHHDDAEASRGRVVAYVLNLTTEEWRPEWGGYLHFFDADWNIEQGIRPQFNTLNLFRVPQLHSVAEVSSFAPNARFAITGWARDR